KTVAPGTSKSVTFSTAGTFAYHCAIHPFMHGSVGVRMKTDRTSGTTSDVFHISWATGLITPGHGYDVQYRKGSGTWKTWFSNTTQQQGSWSPPSSGNWSFRSRSRQSSTVSGYSPLLKVTVL